MSEERYAVQPDPHEKDCWQIWDREWMEVTVDDMAKSHAQKAARSLNDRDKVRKGRGKL